MVAEVTKRA
jgi:midasin